MRVKELALVMLDHFDASFLDPLLRKIEKIFMVETSVYEWDSVSPASRSDFKNGLKYRSTELINFFSDHLPPDMEKMMFITCNDLYSPVFASYFGEAQLNGRVGIVSTFLLRGEQYKEETSELVFRSRIEKVLIHETGHLFGLKHCRDPFCVMKLSGKVSDIDIKSPLFCSTCSNVLKNSTATD